MPDPAPRIVRRDPEDADLQLLLHQAVAELRDRYGAQAGSPVRDGTEYYLAYRGSEAVGCAGLQPMTTRVIELKRMFVPVPLRGQGVARALLSALEREATRRGMKCLRLQTGSSQVSTTLESEAVATVENEATQTDWMGDLSGGLGSNSSAGRGWCFAASGRAGSGDRQVDG